MYYSLRLAECTHGSDTTFLRVQVPIVKSGSEWKLSVFRAVPFAYTNMSCYLNLPNKLVAGNKGEVVVFGDIDMISCHLHGERICLIPKINTAFSRLDACIIRLVKRARLEILQQVCPIDCYADSESKMTLVSPRKYILTKSGNQRVSTKCSKTLRRIDGGEIGNAQINLPFDCSLELDDKRIDEDSYPCILPHLKSSVYYNLPLIMAKGSAYYEHDNDKNIQPKTKHILAKNIIANHREEPAKKP